MKREPEFEREVYNLNRKRGVEVKVVSGQDIFVPGRSSIGGQLQGSGCPCTSSG